MALKATIYKATVNVADMDKNVFLDSVLTLARHPSETEERLMLRLLAWLVNAHERLTFTRGLSAEDEPEIWLMNDHNGIEVWIELGLPDERRLKKRAIAQPAYTCILIMPAPRRFGGYKTRASFSKRT